MDIAQNQKQNCNFQSVLYYTNSYAGIILFSTNLRQLSDVRVTVQSSSPVKMKYDKNVYLNDLNESKREILKRRYFFFKQNSSTRSR